MSDLNQLQSWKKIASSILAASFVFCLTVIFWQNLKQEQESEIERNILLAESHLKIELQEKIKDQIITLIQVSKYWNFNPQLPQDREAKATSFINSIDGYQAIILTDINNQNKQIISKVNWEFSQEDLNVVVSQWEEVARKKLKKSDDVMVTPIFDFTSKERLFFVYIPDYQQEKFQGFIVGVLSIDEFLSDLKKQKIDEYVSFSSTQGFVWTFADSNQTAWTQQISQNINQKVKELQFNASLIPFPSEDSSLSEILLGGGIAISLLVGLITALAQTSQEQTEKLQKTNEKLLEEIRLREAALRQYQKVEQERDRLFLLSPDLLCIAGLDGYFKRVNPCFEKTLSYTQAELLAKPFIEFVHPEDRAATLAELENLSTGEPSQKLENRYRCRDGSYICLSWKAASSVEEGLVYAVARDVTEQKQVEALLRSRVDQQAAVAGLGQYAQAQPSLNQLFAEAVTLMANVLEVEYVKVLELLPDGQALLLRAGVGWLEGLVGKAIVGSGSDSQAGYTLLQSEPVVVEDLRTDTRFNGSALLHDHHVVSGMSTIIRLKDRNFGVLGVHTHTKRLFKQDDVNFLQAIANILATGVEQAESTEQLHLLERAINSTSNGIIITDPTKPDNPIIYANSAVERITGFSPSEILGCNPRFFQRENRQQPAIAQLREAIKQAQECNVILQNYRVDGQQIWIELHISPVFNDGGMLTHFIGVQNDITERKQAEVALQASEARLRGILDIAQDAIICVDEQNVIQLFNQGAEQIFGYSATEVIAQPLKMIIPSVDRSVYRGYIQEYCADNRTSPVNKPLEIMARRRDGTEFPSEASVSQLQLAEGVFLTIILRDISEQQAALRERKQAEMDLRESQHRLSTIITAISDALIVVDHSGIIRFVNPAGESLFSRPRLELLGYWFGSLYGEVDRATEVTILHPEGKLIMAEMQVVEIIWEGEPATLASLRDVTERYQAMRQVQQTRNFLQTMIDHLPVAVFVKEAQSEPFGAFTFWNETCEKLFGLTTEQVIGKTVDELFPPDQAKRMIQQDKEAFDWGVMQDIPEELIKSHSLGDRILHTVKIPLYDEEHEPEYLLCISEDITERKLVEEQLRHNAYHDTLTNLPNRAFFMERLQQAIHTVEKQNNSLFAVLFIDLDDFKYINDSLGHAIGDKLLISLTDRLKNCLQERDILARFGGDEFTILLAEVGEFQEVITVAQKIQQELTLPFNLGTHQVFTNASIGIALLTADYQQPEELLRDADIAMYSAKEKGQGNYSIFNRQMHQKMLERLQLETDLRQAIERQEFQVYYQPIVSFKTDKIAGFEALIRWQHPDGSWISPAKFIPITEKTGLIVEIGEWVLYQACSQLKTWHERFPDFGDLTMSVNLSGRQLREPDLVHKIDNIISQTGLRSDCLKLEITESMLMDNPQAVKTTLKHIKSRNIQLSLDDFGTGYSSLSYLHSFPIDTLKIDRAFVVRANSPFKNRAITQAIVTLAQSLGMEVIAEGIETREQLQQLKQLNCEYGQGYLFSKPLPSSDAEILLSSNAKLPDE
jgi:diguanylate cyclase (GGDEF)-like protein/PAS domain S-box-containing protein